MLKLLNFSSPPVINVINISNQFINKKDLR